MTIDAWVEAAVADAERRGLPELRPLIEALAQATRALRAANLTRQEPLPTSQKAGLLGSRRAGLSGPPSGQ
jgi:hypothetical protein